MIEKAEVTYKKEDGLYQIDYSIKINGQAGLRKSMWVSEDVLVGSHNLDPVDLLMIEEPMLTREQATDLITKIHSEPYK